VEAGSGSLRDAGAQFALRLATAQSSARARVLRRLAAETAAARSLWRACERAGGRDAAVAAVARASAQRAVERRLVARLEELRLDAAAPGRWPPPADACIRGWIRDVAAPALAAGAAPRATADGSAVDLAGAAAVASELAAAGVPCSVVVEVGSGWGRLARPLLAGGGAAYVAVDAPSSLLVTAAVLELLADPPVQTLRPLGADEPLTRERLVDPGGVRLCAVAELERLAAGAVDLVVLAPGVADVAPAAPAAALAAAARAGAAVWLDPAAPDAVRDPVAADAARRGRRARPVAGGVLYEPAVPTSAR
jgi:hypothetical protein